MSSSSLLQMLQNIQNALREARDKSTITNELWRSVDNYLHDNYSSITPIDGTRNVSKASYKTWIKSELNKDDLASNLFEIMNFRSVSLATKRMIRAKLEDLGSPLD